MIIIILKIYKDKLVNFKLKIADDTKDISKKLQ